MSNRLRADGFSSLADKVSSMEMHGGAIEQLLRTNTRELESEGFSRKEIKSIALVFHIDLSWEEAGMSASVTSGGSGSVGAGEVEVGIYKNPMVEPVQGPPSGASRTSASGRLVKGSVKEMKGSSAFRDAVGSRELKEFLKSSTNFILNGPLEGEAA